MDGDVDWSPGRSVMKGKRHKWTEGDDGWDSEVTRRQFRVAYVHSKMFRLPTDRPALLQLARLVPHDFTGARPEDRAWRHVLANGGTPTPEAIANRLAAVQAVEDRRLLRDDPGPEVAAWIDAYIAERGVGPCWNEVGKAMGWPPWRTERILPALQRQGWVSMASTPRSLRSGTGPSCCQAPASVPEESARRLI
ncbi:hypothetical protein [Catenulispora subtropica]|uniref:Uncharacterized protein n=1 Tax=Catenulispora subtropica TaxID=450798 RepID=A0ABN2QWL3_9ACTN